MKTLLQNLDTGLYLDVNGAWTADLACARNFLSPRQATEFKMVRRLAHACAVVVPENPPDRAVGSWSGKTGEPLPC
jgi:hypothetical protein